MVLIIYYEKSYHTVAMTDVNKMCSILWKDCVDVGVQLHIYVTFSFWEFV